MALRNKEKNQAKDKGYQQLKITFNKANANQPLNKSSFTNNKSNSGHSK